MHIAVRGIKMVIEQGFRQQTNCRHLSASGQNFKLERFGIERGYSIVSKHGDLREGSKLESVAELVFRLFKTTSALSEQSALLLQQHRPGTGF